MLTAVRLLIACCLLVASSSTAVADTTDVKCPDGSDPNPITYECNGDATDDGSSGQEDPGKETFTGKRECIDDGGNGKPTKVDCVSGFGVWSNGYDCYVGPREDPQPPKTDEVWEGHTDGAIYSCYNPDRKPSDSPDPVGFLRRVWLRNTPIDQEQLARHAVDQMNLRAIEIGLSVPDLPDRMIYVGAPVWMWTNDPAAETLGPNSLSATAGNVTVTARAHLDSITWTMGDGHQITCAGTHRAKGTPYKPGYGNTASPTCGYRYQHPARRVTIQPVSHWSVDWTGPGQNGTFAFDLTRNTTRRVGEIQVVIDRR
jgi:hypothetical protein